MNGVCVSSVARPVALQAPPQPPKESFSWPEALALPDYVWGGGSAALAAASGYADRFPAGGVTINPGGIIRNPEWTRNFEPGHVLRDAQPIVSVFACGIAAARGSMELMQASRTGDARTRLAGFLDMGLAAASALQLASPGLAGAASLALTAARFAVEFHP